MAEKLCKNSEKSGRISAQGDVPGMHLKTKPSEKWRAFVFALYTHSSPHALILIGPYKHRFFRLKIAKKVGEN